MQTGKITENTSSHAAKTISFKIEGPWKSLNYDASIDNSPVHLNDIKNKWIKDNGLGTPEDEVTSWISYVDQVPFKCEMYKTVMMMTIAVIQLTKSIKYSIIYSLTLTHIILLELVTSFHKMVYALATKHLQNIKRHLNDENRI